ncbi:MAG TPA: chorismate mutase [Syntrophomonadaceae bacterium]|nr:chorismate mutase [Syntrophomonadaceae bacterium]
MLLRGIRGATTVDEDCADDIIFATRELLEEIVRLNDIDVEQVASVLFTVTPDIRSAFPAQAARVMGWRMVPLLCFQEIEVKGALDRCIRVLIHVNTEKEQKDIKHVYLREAKRLRKDLE